MTTIQTATSRTLWSAIKDVVKERVDNIKSALSVVRDKVIEWFHNITWYEVAIGVVLAIVLEPYMSSLLFEIITPYPLQSGSLLVDVVLLFSEVFVINVGWALFRRAMIVYSGMRLASAVHATIQGVHKAIIWHKGIDKMGWLLIPVTIPICVAYELAILLKSRIFGITRKMAVKAAQRVVPPIRGPVGHVPQFSSVGRTPIKSKMTIEYHEATTKHYDITIGIPGSEGNLRWHVTTGKKIPKKDLKTLFPSSGSKEIHISQRHDVMSNAEAEMKGQSVPGTHTVVLESDVWIWKSAEGNLHFTCEEIYGGRDAIYAFVPYPGIQAHGRLIVKRDKDSKRIERYFRSEKNRKAKRKYPTAKDLSEVPLDQGHMITGKRDGHCVIFIADEHGLRVWGYEESKMVGDGLPRDYSYLFTGHRGVDKPFMGRGELTHRGTATEKPFEITSDVISGSPARGLRVNRSRPLIVVHDVLEIKDTRWKPALPDGHDRLNLINDLVQGDPILKAPPSADTQRGIAKLVDKVSNSRAYDGVVDWTTNTKYKPRIVVGTFKIVDVAQEVGKEGPKQMGYPVIELPDGQRQRVAGRGLSHAVKADLWTNKRKYIGREVKVTSLAGEEWTKHGRIWQPIINFDESPS